MLELGVSLLGLLGMVIVLGVPYLLVSHARLKSRVARLELRHPANGISKNEDASEPAWKSSKHPAYSSSEKEEADEDSKDTAKSAPNALSAAQGEDMVEETASPRREIQDEQTQETPRAFVFRRETLDTLSQWLRENWVLAAGAASLVLAGVFMVQYGAENGLLSPFWRVMAALAFGAILIVGGEVIRRRFGDDATHAMQYLPSALAGAGLIVLFVGTLSARVMYGIIEPGSALAALCLVSVLAVVLGWFYGPFLSALGVIGACAAPFLIGGQSDKSWVFYYYFALIAVAWLAIDTVKHWAWVSVLALIATLLSIWVVYHADGEALHFLVAVLLIAGAAIVIPQRSLLPHHDGASLLDMRFKLLKDKGFPEFPTRLATAVTIVASVAAMVVVTDAAKPEEAYLGLATLVILLIATLLWMRQAPALYDLVLVPGLAILVVLMLQAIDRGPMFLEFKAGIDRLPETAAPVSAWVITAIGVLGSVLAFLRMRQAETMEARGFNTPVFWALLAATYAPAVMLILEFFWNPATVVGAYPWALAAITVAAMMTLLAERSARGPDADQRALRIALFGIAALTLISLALFLLFAKTALTLALALMVLFTVIIDRKYDLPALGLFVQIAVAVITYRLIIDPGFPWATGFDLIEQNLTMRTPMTQVLLAYVGSLVPLTAAWYLVSKTRAKSGLILESAIATIGAVFLSVMITRVFFTPPSNSHAYLGLLAVVWAASMINQLYRLQSSGRFTTLVRGGLAFVYGLLVLQFLGDLIGKANPIFNSDELIMGPPILDSLAVAYLLLGCVFALGAWKLSHLGRYVQIAFAVLASALVAWYIGLEIRRFWRGNDLAVRGITDPELYSYTVALLIASAGVLVIAFWRRSDLLRKLAMAGVVLTIAKVFLIDMSGLSGLTRVFSFMGLGLSLVGLAWLNRVMTAQWNRGNPTDDANSVNEG